ncbi:MAG: ion transporter, partial [Nitrospinota bacterium]|nr:ion transporter [Nitrospinota bacterium]
MKSTRDWKSFLKDVVEKNNTKAGKTFDLAIQSLIVGSLISFSIETLPDLSERTYDYLFIFEVASIGIFTIEYLLRLYFADSKVNFIFSFYGIMDLIAIVPFYMPINADLRVFRAFRLLRLFKLFRYSKAISHYTRAFSIAKDELVLFGSAALIILYLSAVGIYYFENEAQPEAFKSVFHSLWWAVATLTTVGYGDVYPITAGGRIFTFFVLAVGLGIVAVP